MSSIVIPVVIVSVIGLLAGVGLSFASVFMAVPENEKAKEIEEVLPGANCGACGYTGCAGYAEALADESESVSTSLCTPGGNDVSKEISEILGVSFSEVQKKTAVVKCMGNKDNTEIKYNYTGDQTCASASGLFGGPGVCRYGCIGLGDCVRVCEYDAIKVCNGIAVVDKNKCTACTECVAACPKGIIGVVPVSAEGTTTVFCSSKDKPKQAKDNCAAACIKCRRCVKACEFDAVAIVDGVAVIDPARCISCGECVKVCLPKCISLA